MPLERKGSKGVYVDRFFLSDGWTGPKYCLETTPAGLVGHYHLTMTIPWDGAPNGAIRYDGHAEIRHDPADSSHPWELRITGVTATACESPTVNDCPGPLVLDQVRWLTAADGAVSFRFDVRVLANSLQVRAELRSQLHYLVGTVAGEELPLVGSLILRACVNAEFPGPC